MALQAKQSIIVAFSLLSLLSLFLDAYLKTLNLASFFF
jgi:hypothetical protein